MNHELSDIAAISAGAVELLEAAGYMKVGDLARARPAEVAAELSKAKRILKLGAELPERAEVEQWIERARQLTGEGPPAEADGEAEGGAGRGRVVHKQAEGAEREVNYEADPVVVEMLANAPLAIPVPPELMAARQIVVGDVAPGILLNRVCGDLEIRVDTRPAQQAAGAAAGDSKPKELAGQVKRGIDSAKIKSVDQVREERSRVRMSSTRRSDGQVDELRSASEEVNRGKDPDTRWFVRGLLHPQPWRMRAAAVSTLLCQLLVLPALAASVLLLLAVIDPVGFAWVSPWWLALPLSLPLCGALFMLCAFGAKCRVCTQRLFLPRRCRKHPKAHHLPWLGYILPLAVHLLTFHWYRCTYCGTAARLRK